MGVRGTRQLYVPAECTLTRQSQLAVIKIAWLRSRYARPVSGSARNEPGDVAATYRYRPPNRKLSNAEFTYEERLVYNGHILINHLHGVFATFHLAEGRWKNPGGCGGGDTRCCL